MSKKSSRHARAGAGRVLLLGAVSLVWLVPGAATAQQSLVTRLSPVLNGGICGNVTDATLNSATCLGGLTAAEASETVIQLSGNTAAAAGSNASETTIAQKDAQSDRLGELRSQPAPADGASRLGGFLTAFGGWGDSELRGEEPGYEYDGGGFIGGFDYRLHDNAVVGAGFGWNRQTTEFGTNASATAGRTVGGGELEADSYVTSLYGGWTHGALYVDGMFSYTYVDYEGERNIIAPRDGGPSGVSGVATSDNDAHQVGLSIGGGHPFELHGVTVGPTVRMNYLHTSIDSYREQGFASLALAYDDQKIHSLVTSIGGEASMPISTDFGVFLPHLSITWEHQFKDDPRSINSRFILDDSGGANNITVRTDSPDRNYARLGTGVSAQLKDGISAFVDYETVLGLERIDAHKITFGGRMEF